MSILTIQQGRLLVKVEAQHEVWRHLRRSAKDKSLLVFMRRFYSPTQ